MKEIQLIAVRAENYRSGGSYYKDSIFEDLLTLLSRLEQLQAENTRLKEQNAKYDENLRRFAAPPETIGEYT